MIDAELAATPFDSLDALNNAFEGGLRRMLADDALGAFILVLANATSDVASFDRLRTDLIDGYADWCVRFDRGHPAVRAAAVDDIAVFERLRAYGLENLGVSRHRRVGRWELQLNPVRAFRPPRMSRVADCALHAPFDPEGFHFDRPYLRPEILWEGVLLDEPVRVLFNKFPFAEHHALLVPAPDRHRPQYLNDRIIRSVWRIARHLSVGLPGVGFGYNARGAYASVNHLHFQLFVRTQGTYPVEASEWRHNGGHMPYPFEVAVLTDVEALANAVAHGQSGDRPFNLLIRPDRAYLVARAHQGAYQHSDWTAGFAWSEVAGAITVFDHQAFEDLGERDLDAEYRRLTLKP